MAQVFISYSRKDLDFIEQLASDLKETGLSVWYDLSGLDGGARWSREIEKAIRASQYVLVVLSPDSVASKWVEEEFLYASELDKKIVPLFYRQCSLPFGYRTLHFVNVQGDNYRQNFGEILRALDTEPVVQKKPDEIEQEELARKQAEERARQERERQEREAAEMAARERAKREEAERRATQKDVRAKTFSQSVTKLKSIIRNSVPVLRIIGILGVIAILFWGGSWALPKIIAAIPTPKASETLPPVSDTPAQIDLSKEITDSYGIEMVLIPKGEFVMGSDRGEDDEKPAHVLVLPDFYIDKYEVTNSLYKKCVDAEICAVPKFSGSKTRSTYYGNSRFDNYPVIYVDLYMAKAYCKWRGARLPTEAEWEKAARGKDERTYPWGEGIDLSYANFLGFRTDTASVGEYSKGISPYGAYDMAGNVWEWVSSRYMPYPYNRPGDREDMNVPDYHVKRGGSWKSGNLDLRSSDRQRGYPTNISDDTGFRCARDTNQ